MTANKETYVKAPAVFRASTAKAILVEFNSGEELEWVPRSTLSYSCDQAIDQLSRNEEFELTIAIWMAIEIGLEY